MAWRLVLLVGLLGSGCDFELPPLPKDIYIEERFSESEVLLIEEAIQETNDILIKPCLGFDGLVYKGIKDDPNDFDPDGSDYGDEFHLVYKVYREDEAYKVLVDLADRDFGGNATLQDVIMVSNLDEIPGIDERVVEIELIPDFESNEKLKKEYDDLKTRRQALIRHFKRVIRHELGHHVGLSHNPDPGALMFADEKSVSTFAEPDKEAFAFVRGCVYN